MGLVLNIGEYWVKYWEKTQYRLNTRTQYEINTQYIFWTPLVAAAIQSGSAGAWPLVLVDKLAAVFADNRPDKQRPHLLSKWKKLSKKFIKRYQTVAANDCQFAENYEDESVDFDSINACRVRLSTSDLCSITYA